MYPDFIKNAAMKAGKATKAVAQKSKVSKDKK